MNRNIKKSTHALKRMNQRAIRQSIIETVFQFGSIRGDKIIMDKKNSQLVLQQLEQITKNIKKQRNNKHGLDINH